jgi:hypothetical protein
MTDTERQPDEVRDTLSVGLAATRTVGGALSRKADRTDVWKIVTIGCLVAAAIAIAVSVPAAISASSTRAVALAAQEAGNESRQRAEQAYAAAQLANEELKRRGQEPVALPSPSEGNAPETLVAAATARVLASLPQGSPYDAQALGRAVASYFLANPVTVPPELVSSRVADYLQRNPPPAGEDGSDGEDGVDGADGKDGTNGVDGKNGEPGVKGDKGDAGPPPTGAEIMAAFNQAAQDNPSLLCAGKGSFTLVRGVLTRPNPENPAEQIPQDIWTCVPTQPSG